MNTYQTHNNIDRFSVANLRLVVMVVGLLIPFMTSATDPASRVMVYSGSSCTSNKTAELKHFRGHAYNNSKTDDIWLECPIVYVDKSGSIYNPEFIPEFLTVGVHVVDAHPGRDILCQLWSNSNYYAGIFSSGQGKTRRSRWSKTTARTNVLKETSPSQSGRVPFLACRVPAAYRDKKTGEVKGVSGILGYSVNGYTWGS